MASDIQGSSVEVLGRSMEAEYVFVDENSRDQDTTLFGNEEILNEVVLPDNETLTLTEQRLVSRLKELADENEGLKSVLVENNTVLQNCFKELHQWQDEQKDNQQKLIEKHKQARNVIKTLKEKNDALKMELKGTKQNLALQIENLSQPGGTDGNTVDAKLTEKVQELEDENKMLLHEKALFEKNYVIVQGQIRQIMNSAEPQSQLSFTDTESLLKIVDSLMSSLNYSEEKNEPIPLQEAHNPQADVNMNYDALKVDFEEMALQYEKILSEQKQVKQAYMDLQKEREHGKLQAENLQTNLQEMKANYEKLKIENEEFQQSFKNLETERENERKKSQEEINMLNRQLQECHNGKEKENSILREEISRKDEQMSSYKKTNATLLDYTNKKEDEVETLSAKIEQMQDDVSKKTSELKVLQEKVEELERDRKEFDETLKQTDANAKVELTKLQNIIVQQSADLQSASDKIRELENTGIKTLQMLESEKQTFQIKEEEANILAQELEETKAELQLMIDGGEKTNQQENVEYSIPLQGDSLLLEYNALKEKHEHLKFHLDKVDERNNKYLNQLEESKEKNLDLERKCNSLQEESHEKILDLDRKCNSKQEEVNQLQSEKKELDLQLQQILQENTDMQLENDTLKDQVCTMYQDFVEQQRLIEEFKHKIDTSQEKSRKDAQMIMNLRTKLSQDTLIVEERETLRKQYDELSEQNEKLMKDYQEMLGRLEEETGHNKALRMEIRNLNEKHNEDAAKIISAEELAGNNKKEEMKLKKQLSDVQETIPLLQQQVEGYSNDFKAEKEACDKLRAENHRLREELNMLQQRSQRMEEQLDHMGNSRMEEMMRRHASSLQNPTGLPQSSSVPNINQQGQPRNGGSEIYDHLYRGYQSAPPPVPNVPDRDQNNYGHLNYQEEAQIPYIAPCPICGRDFVDMEALQNHIEECLVASDDDPRLKCPRCDVEYPDMDSLQIHVMACLDED